MHLLTHFLWWFTGGRDESGAAYGLWSGFLGSIQPTLIGTAAVLWWHHTCHVSACWRPGRHPVGDTGYRTCRKHHPALPSGRVTPQHIADAHVRSRM